MRGCRVNVKQLDGRELSGTALGIDADGALRLKLDTGDERRIIAGDVTIVRDPIGHGGPSRRPKEA